MYAHKVLIWKTRGGVAYLKVGVQNPATANEPDKFWVYPLLGVQNPQFEPPIWGTYVTVKTT